MVAPTEVTHSEVPRLLSAKPGQKLFFFCVCVCVFVLVVQFGKRLQSGQEVTKSFLSPGNMRPSGRRGPAGSRSPRPPQSSRCPRRPPAPSGPYQKPTKNTHRAGDLISFGGGGQPRRFFKPRGSIWLVCVSGCPRLLFEKG